MGDTCPDGPLHLKKHLGPCNDALDGVVRSSVHHPISVVRSIHCTCIPSGLQRAVRPGSNRADGDRRTEIRKRIESSRAGDSSPAGDSGLRPDPDRRVACRFFSINLNDEEGVVHATCRRCDALVILYDRALYWGVKRASGIAPEVFPYKCSCGSHAFEIALGFEYPADFLDENDLNTITVVVRCATCNEIAVIFDDEAT
jgi:hypothetical protein